MVELSIDPSGVGLLTDALSLLNSEKGERDSCGSCCVGGRESCRGGLSQRDGQTSLFYLLATIDTYRETVAELVASLFDVDCGCIEAHIKANPMLLLDKHASCIPHEPGLVHSTAEI